MIEEINKTTSTESGAEFEPKLGNLNKDELTNDAKSSASTSGATQSASSPHKRTYLEVQKNSDIEKYKNFLIKPLETKRLKPSDALSKVRDFLPLLKESTTKLLDDFKQNPDLVNMENVEDDEQHIEMNLAYVTESDSDSDSDNGNTSSNSSSECSSENDDSTVQSPSALDELGLGFKVKDTTKPKLKLTSKLKKKPIIKIIDSKDAGEDQPDCNLEIENSPNKGQLEEK